MQPTNLKYLLSGPLQKMFDLVQCPHFVKSKSGQVICSRSVSKLGEEGLDSKPDFSAFCVNKGKKKIFKYM